MPHHRQLNALALVSELDLVVLDTVRSRIGRFVCVRSAERVVQGNETDTFVSDRVELQVCLSSAVAHCTPWETQCCMPQTPHPHGGSWATAYYTVLRALPPIGTVAHRCCSLAAGSRRCRCFRRSLACCMRRCMRRHSRSCGTHYWCSCSKRAARSRSSRKPTASHSSAIASGPSPLLPAPLQAHPCSLLMRTRPCRPQRAMQFAPVGVLRSASVRAGAVDSRRSWRRRGTAGTALLHSK